MSIWNDFFVQVMIIILVSIAVGFIIDILIDPFNLESE